MQCGLVCPTPHASAGPRTTLSSGGGGHGHESALRADLTFADVALVLWSLGPVMDATATVAPEAWRRHLHLVLDGLRAQAATPCAQSRLTDDDLHAAMRALRESQRRR